MNKTAIKNFAIQARVQLIEAVKQRAYEYEITENGENKASLDTVGDRLLTQTEKEQRSQLIQAIRRKGYAQVMEEAAYTWFNRFIALRFMEVNGYLPSKVRVFTDETGAFKPEIMKQAMSVELEGLDHSRVLELLDKQNNEELYKYLLITQCNALNAGLPDMFEKLGGWTELLFPANLLRADSVVGQMVSMIPEEDWTDAVQIIGWLYQYYNSELKDETFALLKKNVKITKERIPAATQLFTPDWIVRYMVENSLGRIAISSELSAFSFKNETERAAKEKEIADSCGWKYYLPEAEQTPEVRQKLTANSYQLTAEKLTSLKLIDPCMGSGHILVYAFDVLMQIYTSAGWPERDAAQSILENNLYGLDIDGRAAQLAWFAVMMKARQVDRRILSRGVKPHIYGFRESNYVNPDYLKLFGDLAPLAQKLHDNFRDAMEYGSIIEIKLSPEELAQLRRSLEAIRGREYDNFFDSARQAGLADDFMPLLDLAEALKQKYDVVVTNPPYMGSGGMSGKLSEYVKKYYPDSKSDLFAVFIERCGKLTRPNGYQAMITQHAWMFLSSYEKLRAKLQTMDTVNMAHLGARAFEEIGGEVVQTTSFVIRQSLVKEYAGIYCRLIEPTTQQGKEDLYLSGKNRLTVQQSNFSKIPGSPVAYWASDATYNLFQERIILDYAVPRHGMSTGNNDFCLKLWFEVKNDLIKYDASSLKDFDLSGKRYAPYKKGGSFRLWYGNNDYVIAYDEPSRVKMQSFSGYRSSSTEYFFKPSINWSDVTSGKLAARVSPSGFAFDGRGASMFDAGKNVFFLLALLASCVTSYLLQMLNPTLTFNIENIATIPVIISKKEIVDDISKENVDLSRADWDSFETSWDFHRHPLV